MHGHDVERRGREVIIVFAIFATFAFFPSDAASQTLDRFAADSVIALDVFGGENVSSRPDGG
jgi:hypothetical protein